MNTFWLHMQSNLSEWYKKIHLKYSCLYYEFIALKPLVYIMLRAYKFLTLGIFFSPLLVMENTIGMRMIALGKIHTCKETER